MAMNWLINNVNTLLLYIDSLLYAFVSFLYQVFIVISRASLFTEASLKTITDRVFTVLGVAMLFYIAYEVILLIIEPKNITGENGAKKIVTKFITSLIIIILLPTIFKWTHVFQNNVLSSNVIGNVILGSGTSETAEGTISSAGTLMALSIGQAFYHPIENGIEYSYLDCLALEPRPNSCVTYIKVYDEAVTAQNPGIFFNDDELKSMANRSIFRDRTIVYYPILSMIAAILALRMIVAFSLDIGIRVAKLGFLQLVAPIPIAQNITQSEGLTQTKWFKSITETYLDIFMKLIIIYFSMFAISMVNNVLGNIWPEENTNFLIKMLSSVAIILGILQFAKDAPTLIKDLFNIELDVNIKKRLEANTYAQRGTAMATGGLASAASNYYAQKTEGTGVLRTIGSTIAGGVSGTVRGQRASEGMSSWSELGQRVTDVKTSTDDARARREARREAAAERYESDEFRVRDDGTKKMLGRGIMSHLQTGAMKDFGERATDWLSGQISNKKLEVIQDTLGKFDNLDAALNAHDKEISALKDREQKAGSDYFKDYVIPQMIWATSSQNIGAAIAKSKIAEEIANSVDGSISDERKSQIEFEVKQQVDMVNSGQLSKTDFERSNINYTQEIYKEITGFYKENINLRDLANKEKNPEIANQYFDSLLKSLSSTIKTSGGGAGREILGDFKNVQDLERAFHEITRTEGDNILSKDEKLKLLSRVSDVKKRLQTMETIQKDQPKGPKKKGD